MINKLIIKVQSRSQSLFLTLSSESSPYPYTSPTAKPPSFPPPHSYSPFTNYLSTLSFHLITLPALHPNTSLYSCNRFSYNHTFSESISNSWSKFLSPPALPLSPSRSSFSSTLILQHYLVSRSPFWLSCEQPPNRVQRLKWKSA